MSKRDRRNRRAFNRVSLKAGDGEQVCATLTKENEPVYFIMPVDASDEDVRAEAFRLRNGRGLSGLEKSLLQFVEREQVDA